MYSDSSGATGRAEEDATHSSFQQHPIPASKSASPSFRKSSPLFWKPGLPFSLVIRDLGRSPTRLKRDKKIVIGGVVYVFVAFEVGSQLLIFEEGGGNGWLEEGSNEVINKKKLKGM